MQIIRTSLNVLTAGVAVLAAYTLFSIPNSAQAAVIYQYTGTNFTYISNPAGPFDTNDLVTGYVEFATDPLAGETGKSDVVDFSFTADSYIIDKAATITHGSAFSFDFDLSLNIINWGAVVATIPGSQSGSIRTCNGPGSDLMIGGSTYCSDAYGSFDDATYTDGSTAFTGANGAWSPVPVPAAVWLFGFGLLGMIGIARRKKVA